RGRLENRLYLVAGEHIATDEVDCPRQPVRDPIELIIQALSRSAAKWLALDPPFPRATLQPAPGHDPRRSPTCPSRGGHADSAFSQIAELQAQRATLLQHDPRSEIGGHPH